MGKACNEYKTEDLGIYRKKRRARIVLEPLHSPPNQKGLNCHAFTGCNSRCYIVLCSSAMPNLKVTRYFPVTLDITVMWMPFRGGWAVLQSSLALHCQWAVTTVLISFTLPVVSVGEMRLHCNNKAQDGQGICLGVAVLHVLVELRSDFSGHS